MNGFEQAWITSTLAPESIKRVRTSDKGYLNKITNEDKSIIVTVLSDNDMVIGIGRNYDELLYSDHYSFIDATKKVAEILELDIVPV